MQKMTTLGMDERLERVLAYAFGWVSGLILFFVEKNRTVRWHAAQSIVTFGSLSLLTFAISTLQSLLGWIPFLGDLTNFGLGLLLRIILWVSIILWFWLIIMAWNNPEYELPVVGRWVRYFV